MAITRNGDVEIYFDTVGNPSDPALLMISGLGRQCIGYRTEFCEQLGALGLFVIRFDNRDVGLSSESSADGADAVAYLLSDMARDALSVLDALGVERAHVLGTSMGGMIAQTMAIEHPERLLTMTSLMSTTGDPDVGRPSPEAQGVFQSPRPTDRDSFVALQLASARAWGSPACYDEQRLIEQANEAFDRSVRPMAFARQLRAIGASGSRTAALAAVTVPTLVVHGDADHLIDWSGGRRTADAIPNARFVLIEGLGHDNPPEYWDQVIALVHEHVAR
jgi:pimeloyl-ACP methyl ester carboxylesterase